jgi:hypothetical protein
MNRSWRFRGWAILWAVLQFALPATASVADARLERESARGAYAHVEATSTASCRPVHAAQCALCQSASHLAVGAERARCPGATTGASREPDALKLQRAARAVNRPSLPRAPPRV